MALTAIVSSMPPASPVVVPKNYVMPVPNEQILLMNNLKQNDGY